MKRYIPNMRNIRNIYGNMNNANSHIPFTVINKNLIREYTEINKKSLVSIDNMDELVSIIIPSYNRYEFLINCIRSCLNQTYLHIEIIVVDDCSTDERYRNGILETFPKTTVLHLPINQRKKYNVLSAQGMTRQEGINIAKGKWIAFLDDDDFLLENKIETQLKYMKTYGYLFSSTNMYTITHNSISDEKLDFSIKELYFNNKGDFVCSFSKYNIIKSNDICNSTVMIHRSIIEKTGDFKPEPYEDLEYWKRALQYTNSLYINIPLTYYTSDIKNIKNYVYS